MRWDQFLERRMRRLDAARRALDDDGALAALLRAGVAWKPRTCERRACGLCAVRRWRLPRRPWQRR